MWQSDEIYPPYAMHEIEVTGPAAPLRLDEGEGGAHVLVCHQGRPVGRFWMVRAHDGLFISDARTSQNGRLRRAFAALVCRSTAPGRYISGAPDRLLRKSLRGYLAILRHIELLRAVARRLRGTSAGDA